MFYYHLGQVLTELRKRRGLTQEEASADICSANYYSKIERGIHIPRLEIVEALLSNMGTEGEFFFGLGTDEELGSLRNFESYVTEAKQRINSTKAFERQLFNFVLAKEKQFRYTNHELLMKEFTDIICDSITLEKILVEQNQEAFTVTELFICNSIAVESFYLNNYEIAYRLFKRIYVYMKTKYTDDKVKAVLLPVVLNNLCVVEFRLGNSGEAQVSCNKGIKEAVNRNSLSPLLALLENQTKIYLSLGQKDMAEISLKETEVIRKLVKINGESDAILIKFAQPYLIAMEY